MQAVPHDVIEDGGDHGLAVHEHIFREFEPVIQVSFMDKYFLSENLVVEIERILADQQFIHDDSQGKHIIFMIVAFLNRIVLRGTVGRRYARLVVQVNCVLLLREGWQDSPKSISLKVNPWQVIILLGLMSKCAILYYFKYLKPCPIVIMIYSFVLMDMIWELFLMQSLKLGVLMQSTNRSLEQVSSFSASKQNLGRNIDNPNLIFLRMMIQWATLLLPFFLLFLSSLLMMIFFLSGGDLRLASSSSMCFFPAQYEPTYQHSTSVRQMVVKPPFCSFFKFPSGIFFTSFIQFRTQKLSFGLGHLLLLGSSSLFQKCSRSIQLRGCSFVAIWLRDSTVEGEQRLILFKPLSRRTRVDCNLQKDSAYLCKLKIRSCSQFNVSEVKFRQIFKSPASLQI